MSALPRLILSVPNSVLALTKGSSRAVWLDRLDRASGRAAPGERRLRALHDFDLLDVERVAGLWPKVARTIDKDVVRSAECPQRQIVARWLTPFAGIDCQFNHV